MKEMTGREFETIRKMAGLGRREFARAIGLRGSNSNNWVTIRRFETEEKTIPGPVQIVCSMIRSSIMDGAGLPRPCRDAMEVTLAASDHG